MTSQAAAVDPYHGLDFLRAVMMLMGVLLHSGVMFLSYDLRVARVGFRRVRQS